VSKAVWNNLDVILGANISIGIRAAAWAGRRRRCQMFWRRTKGTWGAIICTWTSGRRPSEWTRTSRPSTLNSQYRFAELKASSNNAGRKNEKPWKKGACITASSQH